MKIYLDSNVFRFLKQPENIIYLDNVISSKQTNTYCFSEAHLFDLNRDSSQDKFSDMQFMKRITDSICFCFQNSQIKIEDVTPEEYYGLFEWPNINADDIISNSYFSILKIIPINLSQFISIDSLPIGFPDDLKELLMRPTSLYDFFQAFLDFTANLTEEQLRFKTLIKYLHTNALLENIYKNLGIDGFNGIEVFDKKLFRNSYEQYFLKTSTFKDQYNIFLQMYNGLEIFGIVKGKPKKQKMMNLINDGRHAFFGKLCDIVVSSDVDFVNKTKFIFDLFDIKTTVLSTQEFEQFTRLGGIFEL